MRKTSVAVPVAALLFSMGGWVAAAPASADGGQGGHGGGRGEGGNIKIHMLTTPVDDHRNESKVSEFYVEAFDFKADEELNWTIHPGTFGQHGAAVAGGTATFTATDHQGQDISGPLNTDGNLSGTYVAILGDGRGEKHKEFKVDCGQPVPIASPKVVGGMAAVAAPAAVGFFLWRRRRIELA
ncbi:hypothetical protein [Kitasatospora sp. NPDC050543]|uniref:hypothetical protein n=1 Tax=Kitasatospora sp. NPDC050543 TaxID=3364054 RepID=UPI0037B46953